VFKPILYAQRPKRTESLSPSFDETVHDNR
jgi:hypothetical protein